jgi:hypothetical protein
MKQKGNTKTQQQAAGSSNSGTRSEEPVRKKDREGENERNIKAERNWSKRPAKRTFHPDGPGGGYEGL